MAKTISVDEQLADYEAALEQSKAQVASLTERVSELAGFQKEAVDGRDAIAKLQADLATATAASDQAQRAALTAAAQLKDHQQAKAGSDSLVEAASQLAAALKKLL